MGNHLESFLVAGRHPTQPVTGAVRGSFAGSISMIRFASRFNHFPRSSPGDVTGLAIEDEIREACHSARPIRERKDGASCDSVVQR
jgi:hypothetical protein